VIIVPGAGAGVSEQRSSTFTGQVWAHPTVPGVDGVTIATIIFTPAARTFWHRHERGQILQVLSGRGLICSRGESPARLRVGDTVWIPPGELHWHGAGPDSFMSHTAVSLGQTLWDQEVTEADYAADRGAGKDHA